MKKRNILKTGLLSALVTVPVIAGSVLLANNSKQKVTKTNNNSTKETKTVATKNSTLNANINQVAETEFFVPHEDAGFKADATGAYVGSDYVITYQLRDAIDLTEGAAASAKASWSIDYQESYVTIYFGDGTTSTFRAYQLSKDTKNSQIIIKNYHLAGKVVSHIKAYLKSNLNGIQRTDSIGCFNSSDTACTVTCAAASSYYANTQYSLDNGANWTTYTSSGSITIPAKTALYIKSTNLALYISDTNRIGFQFTNGEIFLVGNGMKMLNNTSTITKTNALRLLFSGSTSLVSVSKNFLPSTTTASNCYASMFRDCSNLLNAPKLPADQVQTTSYNNMFASSGIITAPFLEASKVSKYSYGGMFQNCKNLRNAPKISFTGYTSSTNSYACEYMFDGCTNLTDGPTILPATTVGDYGYQYMFRNCSNLLKCPDLEGGKNGAGTIGKFCYFFMFYGCSNLQKLPRLVAKTLAQDCYTSMFENCGATLGATITPDFYINNVFPFVETFADFWAKNMFKGTYQLETPFTLPNWSTLKPFCFSGVNSGCTSIKYIPEGYLHWKTLAKGCYANMFFYCYGLESIGDLPADTLAEACYRGMFHGCTSLKNLPAKEKWGNITNIPPIALKRMFRLCTSLTTIPNDLLANVKTVGNNGMEGMFCGCEKLENCFDLNAETVGNSGYADMFGHNQDSDIEITDPTYGKGTLATCCISLKTAPVIKAKTLGSSALYLMFQGCSSLETAPDLTSVTSFGSNALNSMFVSGTRTFKGSETKTTTHSPTKIKVYENPEDVTGKTLMFTATANFSSTFSGCNIDGHHGGVTSGSKYYYETVE